VADRRANGLGEWFREWHQPLRRFLAQRRASPKADIDDIAQEVFLRLLRYNRTDLIEFPQAYLYKIAANVSAEWATRSSRRLPHNSAWLADLADTLCPQVELEREVQEAELQRALEALIPRSREILRLHFGENLCQEDIAQRLGVTRRIVKRDLARAYATLRMALDSDICADVESMAKRIRPHE
jgi:RNA polymerase sigma factor (sigma-70 family)